MRRDLIVSYWRLMRFHRPIGTALLLWPTLIALWIAGDGRPSLKNIIIFSLGVILTRAAGCVINDIADRKFDGFVARTQDRPLVTAEIKLNSAIILFISLMLMAFILVLNTNLYTIAMSGVAAALAMIYPFMKRITYFPQFVLGAAFSWGIPMAFSAEANHIPNVAWYLFLATFFLTVAYDTLYAVVDKMDDLKIGIKSTAILFGRYDKLCVLLCQGMALILFALVGYLAALGYFYYLVLIGSMLFFCYQYQNSYHNNQAYFKAFMNHQWIGLCLFMAVVLSYF